MPLKVDFTYLLIKLVPKAYHIEIKNKHAPPYNHQQEE
jgi:hypothetical protein